MRQINDSTDNLRNFMDDLSHFLVKLLDKPKLACIVIASVSALFLLPALLAFTPAPTANTADGQALAAYYTELNLSRYNCSSVTEVTDSRTEVEFTLKRADSYDTDAEIEAQCIRDILTIRLETDTFLAEHPESALNGQKITLIFPQHRKDSIVHVSNYDYQTGEMLDSWQMVEWKHE